jgi:hypothetical protein
MAGVAGDKLAVYEVPYDTAEATAEQQRAYVETLDALLAEGRRDDALELFMRLAGSPDEQIEATASPRCGRAYERWPTRSRTTRPGLRDRRPHAARLAKIRQPTLVATGGNVDAFEGAADAIAKSIPQQNVEPS